MGPGACREAGRYRGDRIRAWACQGASAARAMGPGAGREVGTLPAATGSARGVPGRVGGRRASGIGSVLTSPRRSSRRRTVGCRRSRVTSSPRAKPPRPVRTRRSPPPCSCPSRPLAIATYQLRQQGGSCQLDLSSAAGIQIEPSVAN